jgi:hypothetical protein
VITAPRRGNGPKSYEIFENLQKIIHIRSEAFFRHDISLRFCLSWLTINSSLGLYGQKADDYDGYYPYYYHLDA